MAVVVTSVPNTEGLTTEEKIEKISSYLQSLKRDIEYNIECNASTTSESGLTSDDLEGLFSDLGLGEKNIAYWNRIKEITDAQGKIIGEKIAGNINDANILISSLKDKNILLMDGTDITDSTWAMELSAAGFRISKEKLYDEATDTYTWNWRTFGTGNGFTADEIVAGAIYGLTINTCDLIATNMTSGTIQGVAISGNTIDGNTITGGTINGTEITGSTIRGNTITGGSIMGGDITGGTIEGTTISAATVNASTFNTATLNAPTISAAAITGGTITGGTITGNTITGGTINGATINGNTITGGTISGTTISGSNLVTTGEKGDGVWVKDVGYAVYGATSDGAGELAAYFQYDQEGRGTPDEAHKRVFLQTCNGYALKIKSDADMSIEANGTIFQGNVRFMGTTNLGLLLNTSIEWKDDGCIINGEHYIQITDTSIKCLDTNDVVTITSSTGTVAAAYAAAQASGGSES